MTHSGRECETSRGWAEVSGSAVIWWCRSAVHPGLLPPPVYHSRGLDSEIQKGKWLIGKEIEWQNISDYSVKIPLSYLA